MPDKVYLPNTVILYLDTVLANWAKTNNTLHNYLTILACSTNWNNVK